MRLAVISFRGPEYHPNRRLLQAAAQRGVEAFLLHPRRVLIGLGPHGALSMEGLAGDLPTVALPRVGAEISDYSLMVVRHLEKAGVRMINGWRAVDRARNQFRCLQSLARAGLPVLETWLVDSVAAWKQALERLGGPPLVVKPVSGRQGHGVVLVKDPRGPGLDFLLHRRQGLLAQAYMPPQGRQDWRVLVVGERVAGAMRLTPAPGEFRANFHLGASAQALEPPPRVASLALAAARVLGLEVAGVDLMVPAGRSACLVEVNYAPGFKGLEQATGLDVAGIILDHVLVRSRD